MSTLPECARERLNLERRAVDVRKDVVRMIGVARSGHLVSSLSIVDIMTWLYWNVLRVSPEEVSSPSRDRFVLSKGHGCPALYATLANRGFFRREELWSYRRLGAMLQGHPASTRTPGVDASSGSLGMGLGIAVGMALAGRLGKAPYRVVCLAGDGEMQEGAMWEAAMAAHHFSLSKILLIIDRNGVQMEGETEEIMGLEPLDAKLESFGWSVAHADGHDFASLGRALAQTDASGLPGAVIARTVPGHGVSFLENGSLRGKDALNRQRVEMALRELETVERTIEVSLSGEEAIS